MTKRQYYKNYLYSGLLLYPKTQLKFLKFLSNHLWNQYSLAEFYVPFSSVSLAMILKMLPIVSEWNQLITGAGNYCKPKNAVSRLSVVTPQLLQLRIYHFWIPCHNDSKDHCSNLYFRYNSWKERVTFINGL